MNFADLFDYDPETGLLTWKVRRSNRVAIGQVAGAKQINHSDKAYRRHYLHVRLAQGTFLVHRIIWEIMTGTPVPAGLQIDHIDNDGTNNRWANLRLGSRSQNMGNRSRNRSRKYDLPKGVGFHNRDCLYYGRLCDHTVKYSKDIAIAEAAYNQAAREHYGDFAKPDDGSETSVDGGDNRLEQ